MNLHTVQVLSIWICFSLHSRLLNWCIYFLQLLCFVLFCFVCFVLPFVTLVLFLVFLFCFYLLFWLLFNFCFLFRFSFYFLFVLFRVCACVLLFCWRKKAVQISNNMRRENRIVILGWFGWNVSISANISPLLPLCAFPIIDWHKTCCSVIYSLLAGLVACHIERQLSPHFQL